MRRIGAAVALVGVVGCGGGYSGGGAVDTDPPFQAFNATRLQVTGNSDGLDECYLLATTEALRSRGLMDVTSLGRYKGMVFVFAEDVTSRFYMRNTDLPLSIAFYDASGRRVGAADMDPCPDSVTSCPLYGPDAAYRIAVEVPKGQLEARGLGDGSQVALGPDC